MEINLLFDKIKRGDEESFKQLFYHFYPGLIAFAQSYLYDRGKSEDMVQDVFLYIWEHAAEMEIETSLKAYLYTMTRNRCLNMLRSLKITESLQDLDLLAGLRTGQDLFLDEDNKKRLARIHDIIDLGYIDCYRCGRIENGIQKNSSWRRSNG